MSIIPEGKTVARFREVCRQSTAPENKRKLELIENAYTELSQMGEYKFVVKYQGSSDEIRRKMCDEISGNTSSRLNDDNSSLFGDDSTLEKAIKSSIESENQRKSSKLLKMSKLLGSVDRDVLKEYLKATDNQSKVLRDDVFDDNVPTVNISNKPAQSIVNTGKVKNARVPFTSKISDTSDDVFQFGQSTPIKKEYSNENVSKYLGHFSAYDNRFDHYCIVPKITTAIAKDGINNEELCTVICVILYLWIINDNECIKIRKERKLNTDAHKILYFHSVGGIDLAIDNLYAIVNSKNMPNSSSTARIGSIANLLGIQIECINGSKKKVFGNKSNMIMTVVVIGGQCVIDCGINEFRCPEDECVVVSFTDAFKSLEITDDDYQLAVSNKHINHNPIYDGLLRKNSSKRFIPNEFDNLFNF